MSTTAPPNSTFGLALTGGGAIFMLLGVMLFFNSALLALGNIFLVVGVANLVGASAVFNFASQPEKRKGSAIVLAGFGLVLYSWGIIGLVVEAFGFFELFGDLLPAALNLLRQIPLLGQLFSAPAPVEERPQTLAATFTNSILGALSQPTKAGQGTGQGAGLMGDIAKQFGGVALGGLGELRRRATGGGAAQ